MVALVKLFGKQRLSEYDSSVAASPEEAVVRNHREVSTQLTPIL